jgi:hypothetical protein
MRWKVKSIKLDSVHLFTLSFSPHIVADLGAKGDELYLTHRIRLGDARKTLWGYRKVIDFEQSVLNSNGLCGHQH